MGGGYIPFGPVMVGRYHMATDCLDDIFLPKRQREEEKSSVKLLQNNFRNLGKIIDIFELDTHC